MLDTAVHACYPACEVRGLTQGNLWNLVASKPRIKELQVQKKYAVSKKIRWKKITRVGDLAQW